MPVGPRPPIPPGVCRVAVGGTAFGHVWTQVFYLELTGAAVTVNDLQSVSDEIATLWNTNIAPHVSPSIIMTFVSLVYIPSAGNELTFEGVYNHPGTAAGTVIDNAASAYVIQWKISAYYRGGHPRSYLPGVMSADVTNGSDVAASAQTAITTGANAFRNALNAFTTVNITAIVMGTLSFQSANVWRATPLFRPFTSVAVSHKLGSQRRRILS